MGSTSANMERMLTKLSQLPSGMKLKLRKKFVNNIISILIFCFKNFLLIVPPKTKDVRFFFV